MYFDARVEEKRVRFLLDTGSDVTVINSSIFNSFSCTKDITLISDNSSYRAANGEALYAVGFCNLVIKIGSMTYPHQVLVADIAEYAILGNDFLRKYKANINLSLNKLRIGRNSVPLISDPGSFKCCKVTTFRDTFIPAESEVVIEGFIKRRGPLFMEGVVEPVAKVKRSHPEILIGKTLVDCETNTVPIRVVNASSEPSTLSQGTCLGMLYPIDSVVSSVPKEILEPNDIDELLKELLVRTTSDMSAEKKETITQFLMKNQEVFIKSDGKLGRCDWYKHDIDTGDALPIKQRPYRLPIYKRKEVEDQIADMLDQGIITPSNSPWAAPIVLVKKKQTQAQIQKQEVSYRFCVDYRKLNEVTRSDAYPLPRIDDTIDALAGSQYFSTLDLASGYHQMGLSERAKDKTSFTTGQGLYRFEVLPFGLSGAPSSFERLMERVLAGLHWSICLIYLDDIIVYSDTFEQHVERLQLVFDCLRNAGLKLKPQKCHLFQTEVLYLGHIVSKDGIKSDPSKIERVRDWPVPRNVSEVRSFVGLCSYYKKFVDGFADLCRPLYHLTKKDVKFVWSDECEESFKQLKFALQHSVTLQYPDFELPFILDTDASDFSSGAVLSQMHDGVEKVVAYYSTTHSAPERKYSVTRKELLAVIKSIKHFKHYLYGREFVLRTDHASLKWLMNFKEPEGQVARWLEFLSSYQFKIEHRQGCKHLNADALSRIPLCNNVMFDGLKWTSQEMCQFQDDDSVLKEVKELLSLDSKPSYDEIASKCKDVKSYWTQWEQLELIDNILYRIWYDVRGDEIRKLLVIPAALTKEILSLSHDSPSGGHLGIAKTVNRIKQKFFWLGIKSDVIHWIKTCQLCQTRKTPVPAVRAPLTNIVASEPMELVVIDITGPLPITERENKYILVVGDMFTKWIENYPMPDQEAKTVAQVLVYKFFSRFGVPKQLHSDQGTNFESKLFKEICQLMGIEKTRSSAYHAQTAGMIERYNRTLKNMLSVYVQADQSDWDLHLPLISMAYRSTVHETTGITPNKLMLGREINTPLSLMAELPPDSPKTTLEYVEELQRRFQSAHKLAREHIKTQQRRQKLNYDKKISGKALKEGDLVWLYLPRTHRGLSPKLQRCWTGPFKIEKKLSDVNYVISKPNSRQKQVVHFNRLKPCFLRQEENNPNTSDNSQELDTILEPEMEISIVDGDAGNVECEVLPNNNTDVTDELFYGRPESGSPQDTPQASIDNRGGRRRRPPQWMRSGMYDLS